MECGTLASVLDNVASCGAGARRSPLVGHADRPVAVSTMLSMRWAVILLASAAAVTAQGPSVQSDVRVLRSLSLRVRRPNDPPGRQTLLPLHLGHNSSGPVTEFHPNVSEYTVIVPGFNSTADAIRSVRLYAEADDDHLSEVRVISYINPGDFDDSGFDNSDVRPELEDPYCAAGDATDKCKPYMPDGQQGGLPFLLNPHEGMRTKFELVACPHGDGEQACEELGTTYTLWVLFPDWIKGVAPGASMSWGWVAGCVLCEISAFLYACGICLQRHGLSLSSEQSTRDKRPSIAGLPGSELEPSVASHIVTAPPGSVAGQMVSVYVNGRQVRVEVPVGVGGGDQFSVPIVDGGVGLSDDSRGSCWHVGVGCCCITIDRANFIWAGGMCLWFVGNSLYTYALNFAPLSLLTALFATVLVFNGLLAWFFLHEKVRGSDIVGWSLIMAGISVCGVYIDKEVKQFSARQILVLAGKPAALVYELSVVAMIVGITASVCVWTSRHPGKVGPFPPFMQFAFPGVIAMYECLIQICLKGISNMVDLTYNGSNQFDQPMFWVIFVLCGLCSIAVMVWMRAGYARFEAVQMLPIQSERPRSTAAARLFRAHF